ncbi:MAG TPA: discoidin domain-containing protein, partial [Streptosporangiaceae bacterium]
MIITLFASAALVLTGLVPGAVAAKAGTAAAKAAAATCGTTDIARGQPTTASSLESASFPAADATDGSLGTRWSSQFSDPQWLEVDLGSVQPLCQVTLNWETAYGKAFQIQ